ncbi:type VI secretion system Vgr family protein [Xanthovirga aplysinae]|uniref:type VI secretion system Vgr family protein n=1 Tax=Xanthovirga aplysinae TaxID=2529853 RepID=UPI0012BB89DD|nr:phage baseplate assembly protein V [Xanthovirga aplysinae]MTI30879.1 Rhs element Vgr protein [Xanthovirga aplysinae]
MATIVYPTIEIAGQKVLKDVNFSLELTQALADHHNFTIKCPAVAVEGEGGALIDKAKTFIGQKISIHFEVITNDSAEKASNMFHGIVLNVSLHKHGGYYGDLLIKGSSPTRLLEHGEDSQSFENKPLPDIISEATKEYPQDLFSLNIAPVYQRAIPYTVQYKETDFNFLKRLARRYGEWFYYDGKQINFGKANKNSFELEYNRNLHDFNFSLNLEPQQFQYMAYDAVQSKVHVASSTQFAEQSKNPFVSHAIEASEKTFSKMPSALYNHSLMEESGEIELSEIAKLQKKKRLNLLLVTGESEHPGINVGDEVKVKGINLKNVEEEDDYGSYRVTGIVHQCDESGNYSNHFEALPADAEVPPYFDENAVPLCETHSGQIVDNNDPEGLARVRVQFPWQAPFNGSTPWIRLVSGHSGGGKGFHMLPEIGEEVLVAFEGGNAEKPYVAGAMFHGGGKSGFQDPQNNIKALRTRSGNTLILNDKDGSISIYDPSGNAVILHGDQNLTIRAPKTLTIAATDINIQAGNSINVISQPAEEGGGEGTITFTAQKSLSAEALDETINITSKQDMTLESSEAATTLKGSTEMTVEGDNLQLIGGSKAVIESSDTDIV